MFGLFKKKETTPQDIVNWFLDADKKKREALLIVLNGINDNPKYELDMQLTRIFHE